MTTTHPYPHRMQYQITQADYSALRTRLSAAVPEDSAGDIHTLLFTSYRNRVSAGPAGGLPAAHETEARFSLHYFDNDPSYLLLERRLEHDFHSSLTERMLLPQVLLTYHREIYTLDGLDLWVALDSDIRASLQHMDFLDPELLARDTAGQEGRLLMEISYSSVIPDHVLCLLEETAPRRKLLA